MDVIGTVVSVEMEATIAKQAGGTYQGARISYRELDGTLREQAFHNNALKFNPKLKVALGNLSPGETFTMVKEKEGEFWNVKDIYAGTQAPASSEKAPTKPGAPSAPAPKSTYATAEERAQTQVYIVRQSTLNAAVNMSTLFKLKSKEEVVALAKFFEAHVMDTDYDDGSIMDLKSDDIDEID